MALNVAQGLAFLHDAGVCHMDVSASNVRLTARCLSLWLSRAAV